MKIIKIDSCKYCDYINRGICLKLNIHVGYYKFNEKIHPNCPLEDYQTEYIKNENKKLKFMIDNGLGWEDLRNDI